MATNIGSLKGLQTVNQLFNDTDTVNDAFRKLSNQLEESLQSLVAGEINESTLPQAELLCQTDLLLQNMRIIYANVMNKKVKNAGQAQSNLSIIDSLIQDRIKSFTEADIATTNERVQTVINNLAKSKGTTIVAAYNPFFITPWHEKKNIMIQCTGRFQFEVLLKTEANTFGSFSNQNSFGIPFHEFFPDTEDSSRSKLRMATYSIQIIKPPGRFSRVSSLAASYRCIIILLPKFPGRIETQGISIKEEIEKKLIITPTILQSSRKRGFNKTVKDYPHHLDAEPGWEIEKGSAIFIPDEVKGRPIPKVRWSLPQELPTRVTYFVTTHKYEIVKHCDKIRFRISAVQKRVIRIEEKLSEDKQLAWGNEYELGVTPNSVAIWHSFDGMKLPLTSDYLGRIITVMRQENRLRLVLKANGELSLFKFHNLTVPIDARL